MENKQSGVYFDEASDCIRNGNEDKLIIIDDVNFVSVGVYKIEVYRKIKEEERREVEQCLKETFETWKKENECNELWVYVVNTDKDYADYLLTILGMTPVEMKPEIKKRFFNKDALKERKSTMFGYELKNEIEKKEYDQLYACVKETLLDISKEEILYITGEGINWFSFYYQRKSNKYLQIYKGGNGYSISLYGYEENLPNVKEQTIKETVRNLLKKVKHGERLKLLMNQEEEMCELFLYAIQVEKVWVRAIQFWSELRKKYSFEEMERKSMLLVENGFELYEVNLEFSIMKFDGKFYGTGGYGSTPVCADSKEECLYLLEKRRIKVRNK